MSTASSLRENLKFTLEVIKGPHAGTKIESEKSNVTVGRDAENDLVLPNDPRVSRQHVEIKQSMGQFYVVNLSQKNFVLLNGSNVTSEKIYSNSVIQVGESEIRLIAEGATGFLSPVASDFAPISPPQTMAMTPPAMGAPRSPPPSAPRPPPMGPPPTFQSTAQGYRASAPAPQAGLLANPRVRFYGILVIVGLVGFYILNSGKSRRTEEKPFRTSEELELSRQESENEIKAFQERKDRMNQQIYQKAYENFLRGYRDYRQGQYARAREAFQVVLNLDPENELAKRYWNLSKIRFDELVKFHMLQGRRYLEKNNYRMCRASFQNVMTMLGADPSNPEYKEALTMHKQCSVALEGRY